MEGRKGLGQLPAPQACSRLPGLSATARREAKSAAGSAGLRVIGAGLPRTGTTSLRAALEQLLGGRCYHMHEVFEHLEHVPFWRSAVAGEAVDWRAFFDGYVAAVDWPASAFWRELMEAFPSAVVVLSVRADAQTWWESADATVLPTARNRQPPKLREWRQMLREIAAARLTSELDDSEAAMAAYEAHNAAVRAGVPPERLLEWRPEDGWEPLCNLLAVPIPAEPFPHRNARSEW